MHMPPSISSGSGNTSSGGDPPAAKALSKSIRLTTIPTPDESEAEASSQREQRSAAIDAELLLLQNDYPNETENSNGNALSSSTPHASTSTHIIHHHPSPSPSHAVKVNTLPRMISVTVPKRPDQPTGLTLQLRAPTDGLSIPHQKSTSSSSGSRRRRNRSGSVSSRNSIHNCNNYSSSSSSPASSSVVITNISPLSPFFYNPTTTTTTSPAGDDIHNDSTTISSSSLQTNDEIVLINNHRVKDPKRAAQMIKAAGTSTGQLTIVASRGTRMEGCVYHLARVEDCDEHTEHTERSDVHQETIRAEQKGRESRWQEHKDKDESTFYSAGGTSDLLQEKEHTATKSSSPTTTNSNINAGGITFASNTTAIIGGTSTPTLVKISFIASNSPFVKTGLKCGDVVLSIDGHAVTSSTEAEARLNNSKKQQKTDGAGAGGAVRVVALLVYSLWDMRHRVLKNELLHLVDYEAKNNAATRSSMEEQHNNSATGGHEQMWQVIWSHQEQETTQDQDQGEDESNKDDEYVMLQIPNTTVTFHLDFDTNGTCSCTNPYEALKSNGNGSNHPSREEARAALELLYQKHVSPAVDALNYHTWRQIRVLSDALAVSSKNNSIVNDTDEGGGFNGGKKELVVASSGTSFKSYPTVVARRSPSGSPQQCKSGAAREQNVAVEPEGQEVVQRRRAGKAPQTQSSGKVDSSSRGLTEERRKPCNSGASREPEAVEPKGHEGMQRRYEFPHPLAEQVDSSPELAERKRPCRSLQPHQRGNTREPEAVEPDGTKVDSSSPEVADRTKRPGRSPKPDSTREPEAVERTRSGRSPKPNQSERVRSSISPQQLQSRGAKRVPEETVPSGEELLNRRRSSKSPNPASSKARNMSPFTKRITARSPKPNQALAKTPSQRTINPASSSDDCGSAERRRRLRQSTKRNGAARQQESDEDEDEVLDKFQEQLGQMQINHRFQRKAKANSNGTPKALNVHTSQPPEIKNDDRATSSSVIPVVGGVQERRRPPARLRRRPSIVPVYRSSKRASMQTDMSALSESASTTSDSSDDSSLSSGTESDSSEDSSSEDDEAAPRRPRTRGQPSTRRSKAKGRRHSPPQGLSNSTQLVVYNPNEAAEVNRKLPSKLKPLKCRLKMRNGDISTKYKVLANTLGAGAFGTVRPCLHRKTHEKLAVKSILKKGNAKNAKLLKNEIGILQRVKHENVVRVVDVIQDKEYIHIVMEECRGGDLFDKIVEGGITLSEQRVGEIVGSLLDAVAYLHDRNIVHRDLKAEHLMLSDDDIYSPIIIIDFGLATTHGPNEPPMTAFAGSAFTVAPEVIQRSYGKQCDLWSVGVITYFLLTQRMPFNAHSDKEIFQKIVSADYGYPQWTEKGLSEEAKDFIDRLLVVNPKRRLTAKQALSHLWIRSHNKTNLDKSTNSAELALVVRSEPQREARYHQGHGRRQQHSGKGKPNARGYHEPVGRAA